MIQRLKQSFLRRLILASVLLTTVTALLVGAAALRIARGQLIEEEAAKLRVQGALLAARLDAAAIRAGRAAEIDAVADRFGTETGARATITDLKGRVLGDSEVALAELEGVENHGARAEIRGALRRGFGTAIRRSETVDIDFLYGAVPVFDGDAVVATMRLAAPLVGVEKKIRALQKTIAYWTLLCLLGAFGLSIYVSRRMHASIADLTAAAERIADGDLEARASAGGGDEIGRLGEVLNGLSLRVADTIAALSAEKMQLRATFDNMVEAVALVGADGRVQEINGVMERLFGVSAQECRGKPFVETVRQAPLEEILSRAAAEGIPQQGELTLFTPKERTFEAHANPILKDGELQGAVLVLHDITRLRRLEEVRKEFVANVSHELRTPLASIKGFAETLRRGGLEDKEHRLEFVETIERGADGLTRLVDDLLELASIESGTRELPKEAIALRAFAEEIWAGLAPLARKRGVTFSNEVDAALRVDFNRAALTQVLRNLFVNAVKYNREKGGVTLRARAQEGGTRVSIEDDGIGIPPRDLPRLFERFYRVDKARSRELGGTGLGLAIVKHLVEAHGGRCGVESVEGAGSTFSFTAPSE